MSKKITYRCKGPRVFAKDMRQDLEARIRGLQVRMKDLASTVAAPMQAKVIKLKKDLDSMKDLADDHYMGRLGCGHDLTEQIGAIPDDGDVYEYKCPACGNTGTVRKATPVAEAGEQ